MGACDCIITKVIIFLIKSDHSAMQMLTLLNFDLQAGPGTIAEAMIRGLPIILNGYIAGQVGFFFVLHRSL